MSDPTHLKGWELVWCDEFEGDQIDHSKWDFELGNGFFDYASHTWIPGWGNEEMQYYTDSPTNVTVKDSLLTIRAVRESIHGCGYTSARLMTRRRDGTPLFTKQYGTSSSAPGCLGARASGRRCGCCLRTIPTVAGPPQARST